MKKKNVEEKKRKKRELGEIFFFFFWLKLGFSHFQQSFRVIIKHNVINLEHTTYVLFNTQKYHCILQLEVEQGPCLDSFVLNK
jgi:hypothetical protein